MVIKYNIPNGKMRIEAETFLREAGRRQICRMLKQLRQSRRECEEYVPEIRKYLWEQIQIENTLTRDYAKKYMDQGTELAELKTQYDEMQSPCYAVFTRDREKLNKARGSIKECKARVTRAKNQMAKHKNLVARYEGILEDVDKLFV